MTLSDKKIPTVLILYFSFSSQTKNLLQAMATGLEQENTSVTWERITTTQRLRFPIGSVSKTFWMMLLTFFRKRFPIAPLSENCFSDFDLIILAGPTWSYSPSGPVLSLFDRDGKRLFAGREVLPLISCRGYWRMHWWGVRQLLRKYKAFVHNVIVFCHPSPEPWRTVGVFFKLAGKVPERMWFSKYYRKYGHTNSQLLEAERFGTLIGQTLATGADIGTLDFKSGKALC
jgi:hypothetical protein